MKNVNALTKQEVVVLKLLAKGWRNAKIADELFVSSRTVETHIYHIFDKLGVSSRMEAALLVLHVESVLRAEISGSSDDAPVVKSYATDIG